MNDKWKPFGQEPLNGTYWIAGTSPEVDCDVDDQGRSIGVPTGERSKYVSLVEIEYEPGSCLEVYPLERNACGDWDETCDITHYMPFKPPAPPKV